MTLRDRLASKQRRRASVRVVIDAKAAGAAALRVTQAQAALAGVQLAGDDVLSAASQGDVDAARADFEGCFVTVEFEALDPDDYEALVAGHVGPDGELDEKAVLPQLAAACALEESVRDADWWASQLGSGLWNAGEVGALLTTLVELNYAVPRPGPGKG